MSESNKCDNVYMRACCENFENTDMKLRFART